MSNHPFVVTLIVVAHLAVLRGTVTMAKPFNVELNRALMAALLDTLAAHRLEPKQQMALLGYDKSQWSRICSSQLPAPSITRIFDALPWPVLFDVIPEWSRVLARHKLQDMAEAASLRRSA